MISGEVRQWLESSTLSPEETLSPKTGWTGLESSPEQRTKIYWFQTISRQQVRVLLGQQHLLLICRWRDLFGVRI